MLLITLSCFFFTQSASSQSKIYFDEEWNTTTKEEAHFYRILYKKDDSLYHVKDFYINGILQMEGFFSDLDKEIFEGEIVWYTDEGKISEKSNYKKGVLHGLSVVYLENEKIDYTTKYIDGRVYEGVVLGGYYKQFFEKGELVKYVEFEAPNDFRNLQTRVYGVERDTIYWMNNQGDKLIGVGIYDSKNSNIIDGLNISNSLLISVHTNYKDSKREGVQKVFYEGKLLSEQIFLDNIIVLERSINPLTLETVEINFKDGEPYNGQLFQFNQIYEYYNEFIYKEGIVIIKNHYELVDGKLILNLEKSYKKQVED